MNRIPVSGIPGLPEALNAYVHGSNLYDSSCSDTARVWFSDGDGGCFIKAAPPGTLEEEARMNGFFHSRGLGPQVMAYLSADRDWMVTRAVPGEDCLYPAYLDDPGRLSETLGQLLRMLHETDPAGCPIGDRNGRYLSGVMQKFQSLPSPSSEERSAWQMVQAHPDLLSSRVLLHGDYCLPNVMLRNWQFSGFLDVGGGGIGDRHIDLYWGCWSILYNLKDERWCSRFLDAYGRQDVDTETLRILDFFEVFG